MGEIVDSSSMSGLYLTSTRPATITQSTGYVDRIAELYTAASGAR
jgi:hypothetical protein